MDTEDRLRDGDAGEGAADDTPESLLEALLVDDAEVHWDPVSGKPHVARRQKSHLDRATRNE